jgi:hypothetical protein
MSPDLQKFLPFLIVIPLILWRMRRMTARRRLKLGMLWIRPALLLLVCAVVLFLPQPGLPVHHFVPMDVVVLAPAIALGVIGGWYLGRTMTVDVHPEDGTLMQQTSPIGLLVILGLVGLRFALRYEARVEAQAWHLDVPLIFDALVVFSATLFTVRSLEIYLRAKKVMRDHLGEAFS